MSCEAADAAVNGDDHAAGGKRSTRRTVCSRAFPKIRWVGGLLRAGAALAVLASQRILHPRTVDRAG